MFPTPPPVSGRRFEKENLGRCEYYKARITQKENGKNIEMFSGWEGKCVGNMYK
jgi:hypothetical protein